MMTENQIRRVEYEWVRLCTAVKAANKAERRMCAKVLSPLPRFGEDAEFDAVCANWDKAFDALQDMGFALESLLNQAQSTLDEKE